MPAVAVAAGQDTRELVRRTRAGDAAAFGRLYDELAPDVARFLAGLRLGLDAARRDDAVQETFLRLLGALSRFDPTRPLRPFALGVARRVALELCRGARSAGEPVERPDPRPGVEERLEAAERRAQVADAMTELDAEDRTLLALRHVNGLTMQELADGLECSLPTARKRLREAQRRLAARLRARGVVAEEVTP